MNPAKSKGDGEKVEHQGTHEQDRFLRGPDEKGPKALPSFARVGLRPGRVILSPQTPPMRGHKQVLAARNRTLGADGWR